MCRSLGKELRVLLGVAKRILLVSSCFWCGYYLVAFESFVFMSLGDCTCWQHQETTVEPRQYGHQWAKKFLAY